MHVDAGLKVLQSSRDQARLQPATAADHLLGRAGRLAPPAPAAAPRQACVQAVQLGDLQPQASSPFSLPACQQAAQLGAASPPCPSSATTPDALPHESPATSWLAGWGKLAEGMGCAAAVVETSAAQELLRRAAMALPVPASSPEQPALSGGASCTVTSGSPRQRSADGRCAAG